MVLFSQLEISSPNIWLNCAGEWDGNVGVVTKLVAKDFIYCAFIFPEFHALKFADRIQNTSKFDQVFYFFVGSQQ
ncbi:MAG: hypothetical protein DWQ05_18000 [Calditrichaeota bacterium]|nr:MAG: hypothetical protein DWQ05_18000 [Calditrichota bacterium]